MSNFTRKLRRELLVAVVLIGGGLLLLPAAVYWVGLEVVGPYEGEGGLWTLTRQVWSDLGAGSPLAWFLVLGPYGIVVLLRLSMRLWRGAPL
jgi:hypothetical protein